MIRLLSGFFGLILMIFFIVIGFYEPRAVVFAILCMVGPILSALFGFKRSWCRYICPRGLLYDQYFSGKKVNKCTPKLVLTTWFRVVIVILIFLTLGFGVCKNVGSLEIWGITIHRMIIVTTLAGVLLGLRYSCRTWCCFCPMGSIASLIISIKKRFK